MRDVITTGSSTETRAVQLREHDTPLVFALRRELAWLEERERQLWGSPDPC